MGSPVRPARLLTRSHQTLVMLISYNQHCHDRRHQKPTDKIFLSTCIKYFSASGAGQGSIDHRIEQAMDLVKSHLMSAVRSEVEELRDKISKLEVNSNVADDFDFHFPYPGHSQPSVKRE